MESDAAGGRSDAKLSPEESQALNSTILEYYKKFGRKRDLEQYFSLNTAQSDIQDVSSLFWRRMKSQDSSDSGEKSRDTSLEVCRIQIKCSAVDIDPVSSQDENPRIKSDSESPPIITEEASKPLDTSRASDDESVKSDDKSSKSEGNNSQKSIDATLDTSINKAFSPTSSITSQRKLEWDSLGDVGYANESGKRTSATSLSTLERLALLQQYSNNDTHKEKLMGPPTAHSTPNDDIEMKCKGKKGSKTTKIYRKDVEFVEFNVPQGSDANPSQSINVNLTKHISFNVDKSGDVFVENVKNVKKDCSISPEKKSVETKETPQITVDKEIQTTLTKTKEKSSSSGEIPRPIHLFGQSVPVLINLNNLKRSRRKKVNTAKKKLRIRKKVSVDKENLPVLEKSGEQVSEAESFEYMPGHIYKQNQMNIEPLRSNQTAGNKSSLESSRAATTDSSKDSKHSFTKDLEHSIKLLRSTLNKRYDNSELKQKLIKEVVQRLLKSSYRDDESTTDFLSGLSFNSKMLGLGEGNTTTSTSDANNTTADKPKPVRPKKSILRVDKFNSNAIASTSQSAPNLPSVSQSENPISTNLAKGLTTSNSSSDASSKGKLSSDTAFAKTSSEELYQKYLDAVRREEAYKKHLRDKEHFLKQKLVSSDNAFNRSSNTITTPSVRLDVKSRIKLKELMKDLTRNNYDDGSGDASKLEGGLAAGIDLKTNEGRNQRSHSVFTLSSSGNSDQNRKSKSNMKKSEMKDVPKAGNSRDGTHYCCCPHHFGNKVGVTDSSVQVNIRSEDGSVPRINDNVAVGPPCPAKAKSNQPVTHIVSDNNTGDIKYLCLCNTEDAEVQSPSENFQIYKCSRLSSKGVCVNVPEMPKTSALRSRNHDAEIAKPSKGSQTCLEKNDFVTKPTICIHEAIRVTQTDMSINPKISDPSLSDIKIINNRDCVKLVCEQFRQVSKSSISTNANVNIEQSDEQIRESDIYNQPSTSTSCLKRGRITAEVENQSEVDLQDRQAQPRGIYEDNGDYTIPIQGTNMTLKVSVGSNPVNNLEILDSQGLERPLDVIGSEEINMYERTGHNDVDLTHAADAIEYGSLTEERCKGVQSDNNCIFSQFERKPRTANTLFTKHGVLSNQVNTSNMNRPQRRPFLRSNTFAGIKESYGTRNEILDDFYEHEQWSTYPKISEPRTLCACPYPNPCQCGRGEGYINPVPGYSGQEGDASSGVVCSEGQEAIGSDSDLNYLREPCTCPMPNECGNVCRKNAACRKLANPVKKVDTSCGPSGGINRGKQKPIQQIAGYMQQPCPCPDNSVCGNICDEDAECRNFDPEKKEKPFKNVIKKLCPCPSTANCGNVCTEDAACIKNMRSAYTETPPVIGTPRNRAEGECYNPEMKMSKCGCPDSKKCGGFCGKDAACRKLIPVLPERFQRSTSPRKTEECIKRPPSPQKTPCNINERRDKESTRNLPCSCPITAKCGGYCGKDAACRKKEPAFGQRPQSPRKTSCSCPDSAKCGGFCAKDAACRNQASDSDEIFKRPLSPRKTNEYFIRPVSPKKTACGKTERTNKEIHRKSPCGCPNSARCEGLCSNNATCRNKTSELKESGPAGDVGLGEDSSEQSDSDYADFETLKAFLKSQTFPLKSKSTRNTRSPSLPVDLKTVEAGKLVMQCKDDNESPVEDRITSNEDMSEPGPSKMQESESSDLIMNVIKDITHRYSKKDLEKTQKKKCFKEIISILKYLLDTEDTTDTEALRGLRHLVVPSSSSDSNGCTQAKKNTVNPFIQPGTSTSRGTCTDKADKDCIQETDCMSKPTEDKKITCDKGIQLSTKKSKSGNCCTESSDLITSSERPCTSSDTVTCKVLNKIKRECEKYHRKCCKRHQSPKRCQCSSTTSMSCDQCRRIVLCQCRSISASCDQCKRVHHCQCRPHNRCKCKSYRPKTVCERVKKKCVAYNLIIQTSESMVSEEVNKDCRPLKNIIVKVPPRKPSACNIPFKEMECEIGKQCSPRSEGRGHRSRSLPNDSLSSTDDGVKGALLTVKDYLERNRPDFIEQSGQRQKCLKMISEARASNRAAQRELLSMQVQLEPALRALSESDLYDLAKQLGFKLRQKREPPKLISEREMKKHSERIYKKLPEFVRKKEELKKENIKKTNLLMANIFKKNLQRKTLRGAVNLSNYSTVIKI